MPKKEGKATKEQGRRRSSHEGIIIYRQAPKWALIWTTHVTLKSGYLVG